MWGPGLVPRVRPWVTKCKTAPFPFEHKHFPVVAAIPAYEESAGYSQKS